MILHGYGIDLTRPRARRRRSAGSVAWMAALRPSPKDWVLCALITASCCASPTSVSLAASASIHKTNATDVYAPAKAVAAPDLQAQFEVIPDDGTRGWLGADSDVSIVIGGGQTGRRALWIFADTYITTYRKSTNQREWDGMEMPHSTVALVDCTATGNNASAGQRQCPNRPTFHWKTSASGKAESFWVLPPDQTDAGLQPLLWQREQRQRAKRLASRRAA